jgi:hypothetical protein
VATSNGCRDIPLHPVPKGESYLLKLRLPTITEAVHCDISTENPPIKGESTVGAGGVPVWNYHPVCSEDKPRYPWYAVPFNKGE